MDVKQIPRNINMGGKGIHSPRKYEFDATIIVLVRFFPFKLGHKIAFSSQTEEVLLQYSIKKRDKAASGGTT
ncbi:MAG: hypothetical protein U0L68_03355 [Prevotellamassilia sp.]|nr:hypothetical protein [Prevotellamassilia sp.]